MFTVGEMYALILLPTLTQAWEGGLTPWSYSFPLKSEQSA